MSRLCCGGGVGNEVWLCASVRKDGSAKRCQSSFVRPSVGNFSFRSAFQCMVVVLDNGKHGYVDLRVLAGSGGLPV